MESQENCGVCGKALIYGTEEKKMTCAFCGKEARALIYCPEGHYVCDSCHSRAAVDVLRDILKTTKSTNPAEILEKVLAHPSVPMHGPEHHAMVPAILVAAAKNAGYPVPDGAIEKAIERGSKIPGGWCGFYGACGAGVGVGIAVSVLTGATPLTGKTRGLANKATAYALGRMADEGARCCKRATRSALDAAVDFFADNLGIRLERGEKVKCVYVKRNKECVGKACAYFPKK
ncbi:MAG TPA: DUF5714 domain-containing protein [Dehalococcoidales bacterium]|nr:DUF5714 domain-containing protein [Dehalococcoidales bacterium]